MSTIQPQSNKTAPRAGEVPCRAFFRQWELHFLDLSPVTVWFSGPVDFETVMARHPAALAAVPVDRGSSTAQNPRISN